MFTGLAATIAWAFASNSFIPFKLIVKPRQRITGTIQARIESSSPGDGLPKCLSNARV